MTVLTKHVYIAAQAQGVITTDSPWADNHHKLLL